MEEDQYRELLHVVRDTPCIFQRAILTGRIACHSAQRTHIAEREQVQCNNALIRLQCEAWLGVLRSKSAFTLHVQDVDEPLPFAKMMRLQLGGLEGLNACLQEKGRSQESIDQMLITALEVYGDLDAVPFETVIKNMAAFKLRPPRRKDK